jgi:hypothetical protein
MRDIKMPDGKTRFRQKIMKNLNEGVETVAIPITSVV